MPEADVVYSDVKFTKTGRNQNEGTAFSSSENTYSEVRISSTQPSTEVPGPQGVVSKKQPGLTSERVALVVLAAFLLAAVIALGFTSYKHIQTTSHLQKLTEELKAVKKNLTERAPFPVHSCPQCPQKCTSPRGPACLTCEKGWKQRDRSCYFFSDDSLAWTESRQACQGKGGDLVQVDSRPEQAFLGGRLKDKMKTSEDKFWIGLTDSEEEKTWLWVNSSRLDPSLAFWSPTQPDDWKEEDPDGEDCVRMGEKTGPDDQNSWFDKSCKVPHRYICEKPAQAGVEKCVLNVKS